jgi:hypothetical protein
MKLRNVAEVQRMFEVAVSFMTLSTLLSRFVAEFYRMLEHTILINDGFALKGLIYGYVTYRAVIPDDLSVAAEVLPIMTPKTAL